MGSKETLAIDRQRCLWYLPDCPTFSDGPSRGSGPGSKYYCNMNSQTWNRATQVLAWIGVFVAGVLSFSHIAGKDAPCGVSGGCTQVINSEAGQLFGVPVAFLGLAGYAGFVALSLLRQTSDEVRFQRLTKIGLWASGLGLLYSGYLQVYSLSNLGEICLWCLASATTMLATFVVHGLMYQANAPTEPAPSSMVTTAVCAIAALGGIGAVTTQMTEQRRTAFKIQTGGLTVAEILPRAEKIKGNPDAKLTLLEVADVNCGACRNAAQIVRKLYDKHGGKLRVAFRHFPLYMIPGHENSVEIALVSEAAADAGKFWDFMDLAFAPQNAQRIKSEPGLMAIAAQAGLDTKELREKLNGEGLFEKVNEDFTLAKDKLKIQGTPTFILLVEGREPEQVAIVDLEKRLTEEPYAGLLR